MLSNCNAQYTESSVLAVPAGPFTKTILVEKSKATLKNSPKLLTIGIDDYYSKGGGYQFLKDKHGLTPGKIVNNILENLK